MTSDGRAASGTAGPEVRVRTVEIGDGSGRLESFSLADGLVLAVRGSDTIKAGAADVVWIRTNRPRRTPDAESIRWELSDGDVLYGRLVGGNERVVTLRREDLGTFDLPITRVRALITPAGRSVRDGQAVRVGDGAVPALTRPAAENDEVLLANGDRLTGVIERVDPNGIALETDDGPMTIGVDVVLSVRLARLGRATTQAGLGEPLRAKLTLADDSILTVTRLQWRGQEVGLELHGGTKLVRRTLGSDHVLRVEVLGGRWRWLSEMRPIVAEHTPLLDVRRPHRRDRNVLGGPIRIGGRRYERGIGVHSRSRLVWRLDDRCRRFVTGYGLDDAGGPMAHVEVAVLLDGKRVHHAADVRADGKIRQVSVDLDGAKQLELLVDFGKNGHVQDRFDWVGPAIIRR